MSFRLETHAGAAGHPYLSALARLRVEIFRDWPYLYDGVVDDARTLAEPIATSPAAALVVAFDGAEVVGCATCLPLADEAAWMTQPFVAAGVDPATVFYFGESLLRPAYRGRGIGVAFFERREAHARRFPGVATAAFCAVRRPPDHPLRPADARPLDRFWHNRGYAKQPDLAVRMAWKQVDGAGKVENVLDAWTRTL